jgi:hypothetical protein
VAFTVDIEGRVIGVERVTGPVDFTTLLDVLGVLLVRKPVAVRCARCGRVVSNYQGGWGIVSGLVLCYSGAPDWPDCYQLAVADPAP